VSAEQLAGNAWRNRSAQLTFDIPSPVFPLATHFARYPDITLPLCTKQNKSGTSVKIGTIRVTVRALSSLEAAKLSLDSAESSVNEFEKNSKTLSAKHAARYKAGYDVLKSICGILDIVGPFIACEVSESGKKN
jgi:hypothetical protein